MNHIVQTQFAQLFSESSPLKMECGVSLGPVTVAYETYGHLNSAGDNAIVVCHALTGSAHAAGYTSEDPKSVGWWDSFIGDGKPLDTTKYFVISSNFLGGCYGTTGPSSNDPKTGRPYGLSFPQMTVRDMVRVQKALTDHLGVNRIATVIGGSLGGMQVLEWGIMYPKLVRSIIPIATSAQHSAWAVGLNDLARQAIMNDPDWRNGDYYSFGQPRKGFSLARQIAMISYRSEIEFTQRFGRERYQTNDRFHPENLFQIESYLRHQGEKLVDRFDANTYLYVSRAMDLHDIAIGRAPFQDVLRSLSMPVLSVGINTDILYPAKEQKEIASFIPTVVYKEISSPFGHDAFLIEFEQMAFVVNDFLRNI